MAAEAAVPATSKNKEQAKKIRTPRFRVSFPNILRPRETNKGQRYGLNMIFPKDTDLSAMKQLLKDVAISEWGKVPKGCKFPFRDGTEKEDWDGYGPDVIFAAASTTTRPGLIHRDRSPITDASEFYGGCYAHATLHAFAWEHTGRKGVSFGLENLQKLADGPAFGGRSAPEEDFDALPEEEDGPPDYDEDDDDI